MTPGLSPAEAAARTSSASLHGIYSDPVNAPLRLVQHLFYHLGHTGAFWMRLPSAIAGLIIAYCFYKLVTGWFGKLIGGLTAAIFVTTPIFMLSVRHASPTILLFALVVAMFLFAWLARTEKYKKLVWVLLLAASAVLLYVPGLVWWVAGAIIICHKRLLRLAIDLPRWVTAAGLLIWALILAPLVISAVSHPSILKHLALLPDHWGSIPHIIKNIGWMFLALFARAPFHFDLDIARQPLLDYAQTALLVIGAYAMWDAASRKAYVLGSNVLLAILLAGINNNPALLALGVPALAILMGAGLRYLYIEWRAVFPVNPVPKLLAASLIFVAVTAQVAYGLHYSLTAWPHTMETHNTYVIK